MTKVLFAGGGTGGHLMPALAIAEAMVAQDPSIEPFFVGSQRGIEARVLPRRPWPHELLPVEPIYRREWWRNIGLPLSLFRTLRGVRRILSEHDPRLVVGTGGYVSGPVVWAALNRRIPGVLQEQNAFPGIATRRLARRVRQIHLGFPEAAARLNPGRRTVVRGSGNPIQPPPSPRPDRGMSKRSLGFDPAKPLILVMGGSQGAVAINRAVAEALGAESWPAGSQLLWQTGDANHANYLHWYQPGLVRVEPFLDPIAEAYAAADLVVCRAGAMSLAESGMKPGGVHPARNDDDPVERDSKMAVNIPLHHFGQRDDPFQTPVPKLPPFDPEVRVPSGKREPPRDKMSRAEIVDRHDILCRRVFVSVDDIEMSKPHLK